MEDRDRDVIRQVKNGDAEAFSILVEKYHYRLLNFIHKIVGDPDVVEDIGQEVFLAVFKSLAHFEEDRGTPFSAWLFIAARNQAINEFRKRRHERSIPVEDLDKFTEYREQDTNQVFKREKWQAIEKSLEQLPQKYRVIILQSLQGNSIKEIARHEAIAPGTVKSRLFRAKEQIRLLIQKRFRSGGHERI